MYRRNRWKHFLKHVFNSHKSHKLWTHGGFQFELIPWARSAVYISNKAFPIVLEAPTLDQSQRPREIDSGARNDRERDSRTNEREIELKQLIEYSWRMAGVLLEAPSKFHFHGSAILYSSRRKLNNFYCVQPTKKHF